MYDSRKIFTSETSPYIHSTLDGIKYAINGIPFPETSVTIPLVVNASTSGTYTIKATQIVGLDNYKIFLTDNLQNFTVNLSETNEYTFNSSIGKFTDRFSITISNISTGVPEININQKPFNIYFAGEQINIQTLSDEWAGKQGTIRIMDLTGRLVSVSNGVALNKDEVWQIPVQGANGLYFVEISDGSIRYVGRVVKR